MPNLGWIVLILCVWLSMFCVSAESTAVLYAVPNRWELPSPLDWRAELVSPIESDCIWITLRLKNQDPNGPDLKFAISSSIGGSVVCYIEVGSNSHNRELQSDSEISIDRTQLTPSAVFNQVISVHQVRLICPNIMLERSNHFLYFTKVQALVEIASIKDVFIEYLQFPPITFDITDAPTFLHQYSWNASKPSMVSVTFTFYRPSSMSDRLSFAFEHPLLDFSTIKSLHSSGDNPATDLGRPYHLVGYAPTEGSRPPLKCHHHSPSVSSDIIFTRTTNADITTEINVPGNAPGEAYRCTFTLDYPADVIYSILSQSSPDDNQKSVIISAGVDVPVVEVGIPIPHEIYAQRSNSATLSKALHLWHSSHHNHDLFDTFEFGIAMTDRSIPNALTRDDIELIGPAREQSELTFELMVVRDSKIYPFEDWAPQMVCREHGEPSPNDENYAPMQDGTMQLELKSFSGLGKTCSLRLTAAPFGVPDSAELKMSMNFRLGEYIFYSHGFSLINAFHTYYKSIRPLFLNTKVVVAIENLPSPVTIPFTIQTDEGSGNAFLVIDMELQYLLPSPLPMDVDAEAEMYISLIFVNTRGPLKVLTAGTSPAAKVTIIPRGGVVVNEDTAPINVPNGEMYPFPFPLVDDTFGRIESTLQHNYPIRSPQIHIRFPTTSTVLEATQPLRMSIQIPVAPDFDGGDMMYAMLAPALYSKLLVYSSEFARITPVRNTPLTGYSYRCVTWDQMAALYVYGGGTRKLTDTNSMVCPSFPQSGGAIDPAVWRRCESMISGGEFRCLYELAAVCVTPSTTVQGAYDVHPLADCPSFLGEIHAIPCSLVEGSLPTWDYSLGQLQADISLPEKEAEDDFIIKKRLLTLWWSYTGDPRLTVTVAIKPLIDNDDSNNEHEPGGEGWITLARDIPANLSQPGLIIGFPILSPAIRRVIIRLSLNELPSLNLHQTINVIHISTAGQWGPGIETGCDMGMNTNKVFDAATYLCRCNDGFVASGPTSVDNPLVHPIEFTCSSACDNLERYHWDALTGRCIDADGNVECDNSGVWSPLFQRCVCMTGYYGQYCQYDDTTDPTLVCDELQCVADHTMKGGVSGEGVISHGECEFDNDNDSDGRSVVCNCADGFTGNQCQHQAVCGLRQCVNGRLISPTGKPEECKCECNNDHITGSACNQCTLACRNGGVANTRCTACQCPAGYIGTTCTIPVWYHTFTLRNLPQHVVELILGTTASDKEQMVILQQTMVKYLLEDYSRVLSETFIVVDGNGNGNNGNNNEDDTRIRVRVELSQFQTVIPPANPNAPYVHIQLMLYPADMTDKMLAYALQHGLDFDWSRVTDNLEFFRKFLREQGIVDDDDDLTPDIDDPGCTTRECREKIIEEESSNHAFPFALTPALVLSISMSLVAIITLIPAYFASLPPSLFSLL